MFGSAANKQLAAVEEVMRTSYRGIYKRIDENRELLELLQREAPQLLKSHFWIEGWLQGQDGFLNDLLNVLPIDHPRPGMMTPYPRPWPVVLPVREVVPIDTRAGGSGR